MIEPENETPNSSIMGNIVYPNPFNPGTNIEFDIIREGYVSVNIFNVKGELVKTIADEVMSSGHFSEYWNASKMESGVYFCVIRTKSNTIRQKSLLLK